MATVFVTFLHSVAIKTLDEWDPYSKDLRKEFTRIWNKVCEEWATSIDFPEDKIWFYRLGENNLHIRDGNLYTIIFEEDKELPEDNFSFLKMLQDKCVQAGLRIAIMDKVTRQREILE